MSVKKRILIQEEDSIDKWGQTSKLENRVKEPIRAVRTLFVNVKT